MKKIGLLMAFLVSCAAPLQAGDLDPVTFALHNGYIQFVMPSNNVECYYTPRNTTGATSDGGAELACDRAEPVYVHVVLGEQGKPQLIKNPGEQPCCSDENVFAYGHSWHEGPFDCDSRSDGLYCTNTDGHGLRLSRSKAEVF